jgi:hypothetical protein
MPDAETHRAHYFFRVKESGGVPWIMFEPSGEGLPILRDSRGRTGHDAFLGLDLPQGTTYERAREIARHLYDHVEEVSCPVFKKGFAGRPALHLFCSR